MNGFIRQFILAFFILAFPVSLSAEEYMFWWGNFPAIDLGRLSNRSSVLSNSSSRSIYTTGDFEIGADNSSAACLAYNGNQLDTRYKITLDGDGITRTGGQPSADYAPYDTFLSSRLQINYVGTDHSLVVRLWVQVTSPENNVPDAGTYTATQTLTLYWTGP